VASMPNRTWSPSPTLVGVGWTCAAGAVLWTLFTHDRGGQLLVGGAGLLLAVLSLHGTLARPRLSADPQGITIRGMFGRRHWPWPRIRSRTVHGRRLGRSTVTLELTVLPAEELIILGQLDLGADPEDVASELRALRP